jgi:hypothetical protein
MRKRPKEHHRPEQATRHEKDGDQKARGKLLWHQTERVMGAPGEYQGGVE